MTTLSIRKKLITYLADADDNKVRALYTLLESEIHEKDAFALTEEQMRILETARELHINGQSNLISGKKRVKLLKAKDLIK